MKNSIFIENEDNFYTKVKVVSDDYSETPTLFSRREVEKDE